MYAENSLMSNVILSVLAILVLLVFMWVLYAIVYSIIMFVFSGGNEEKIKKAWNSIRYALFWFMLTLIILFAVPWFLKVIRVPGYNQYTATNIFKEAKVWLNKMIWVFSKTTDSNYYENNWDYSL